MLGTIENKQDTYGFIRGTDGISRFFLPSGMESTSISFDDAVVGHRVEFVHIDHPRGARAIQVRVLNQTKPYSRLHNDGDQA